MSALAGIDGESPRCNDTTRGPGRVAGTPGRRRLFSGRSAGSAEGERLPHIFSFLTCIFSLDGKKRTVYFAR